MRMADIEKSTGPKCFDVHLPSSERLLSLVSCSICWHQPSMRPVSACRSFRNQFPSRRHAGVLECTPSPWELQFPGSRLGSGGGREEGSKAGSRVSGGKLDVLDGADVCLRWCCSMALSCPLVVVLFRVWLLVQLVAFSVGVASCGWDSTSVFCLEAMLLSRLRLQRYGQKHQLLTNLKKIIGLWAHTMSLRTDCIRIQNNETLRAQKDMTYGTRQQKNWKEMYYWALMFMKLLLPDTTGRRKSSK